MERTVRNSTKAKTVDAEETEKMRLQQQSKANRVRSTERVIRTQHIQKDLLLEGLETEVNAARSFTYNSFFDLLTI